MARSGRERSRRLCTIASWLAAWPLYGAIAPADGALLDLSIGPEVERRSPSADLPDQLLRLLPGELLEDAARTLLDHKVQVRLYRNRTFLRVRIPIG